MNYSFKLSYKLEKGSNSFPIEKSGNAEIEIRRLSDDKIYIQNKDFDVITMNSEMKIIIFKELLDKDDVYEVIAKEYS